MTAIMIETDKRRIAEFFVVSGHPKNSGNFVQIRVVLRNVFSCVVAEFVLFGMLAGESTPERVVDSSVIKYTREIAAEVAENEDFYICRVFRSATGDMPIVNVRNKVVYFVF